MPLDTGLLTFLVDQIDGPNKVEMSFSSASGIQTMFGFKPPIYAKYQNYQYLTHKEFGTTTQIIWIVWEKCQKALITIDAEVASCGRNWAQRCQNNAEIGFYVE